MTKRLVDIDDEVLAEARRALGTTTLKETVNTALAQSVASSRGRGITRESLQRFAEAARDLGDPEIMAKAWE